MSVTRNIGIKSAVKLLGLLLMAASAGVFFIARFVDQLDLQQPITVREPHVRNRQTSEVADQRKRDGSKEDEFVTFSTKVSALLRTLSKPEANAAVLNNHCDEANMSDIKDEQLRYSLQLERLQCYGQMLKDYKEELITLNNLNLMSEDRLNSTIGAIIDFVDKSRSPVKKPHGKEREKRLHRLKIHDIPRETPKDEIPSWVLFQNRINRQALFLDDDKELIDNLLRDLRLFPIDEVDDIPDRGTQMKLVLMMVDESQALFKPKRVERDDYETMDIYYMYEKERHTSEIAAFHLSRILRFNNVPPVAGRYMNMSEELYPYLVDSVQEHFFTSPDGNLCFFGQCEYFCDAGHSICGSGKILEGSMAAFLPDKELADWKSIQNPWKRSYSKYNKTEWETTNDPVGYCNSVRQKPPYHKDKALLNVVDTAIFDFLMGNKDRHHFYYFVRYGNDSYYILIDNGKGFGRAHEDIIDILAPLYQCCMIRYTTLKRLFAFHSNPKERLSRLMKQSLSADVLQDILTPAHLRALDRRVKIILQQVLACIDKRSKEQNIIVDDRYYFERDHLSNVDAPDIEADFHDV